MTVKQNKVGLSEKVTSVDYATLEAYSQLYKLQRNSQPQQTQHLSVLHVSEKKKYIYYE